MEYKHVIYNVSENIAEIKINNIEKRNALTAEIVQEMNDCLMVASKDEKVRVIILRGEGGHFCGGADVKEMPNGLLAGPLHYKLNILATDLKNIKKPTIAHMEGAVAGAGLSIALGCDFTMADENAKCTFAFVKIGLVPDTGAIYHAIRAVGKAKATELLMTGNVFTGAQARDWGMITNAYPKDELDGQVRKLAKTLAEGPTKTYGLIKSMIAKAEYPGWQTIIDLEYEYQNDIAKFTHDHFEGVQAFLDKRKPNFIGK